MSRPQRDYDINLVDLAKRIRQTLKERGWSDAHFERQAGLSGGTLSRLGSGARKRISHQTLRRIADVLGESYLYLVFGVEVGPRLDEIPGYQDAEVEVARLEPRIPIEVLRAARKTHLAASPRTITTEFLRDYVRLMARHSFDIDPDEAPDQSGERRRPTHATNKDRDAGSGAARRRGREAVSRRGR